VIDSRAELRGRALAVYADGLEALFDLRQVLGAEFELGAQKPRNASPAISSS
jgi:hypothetical protein